MINVLFRGTLPVDFATTPGAAAGCAVAGGWAASAGLVAAGGLVGSPAGLAESGALVGTAGSALLHAASATAPAQANEVRNARRDRYPDMWPLPNTLGSQHITM